MWTISGLPRAVPMWPSGRPSRWKGRHRVAGDVIADLFASTSGTDSDWIVKLIDVYPASVPEDPPMGGYELMIAADVLRGRFRNGFEKPEPVGAE